MIWHNATPESAILRSHISTDLSIFRLFHRKYAEAKRCAKNATLVLCKDTSQLRDEVNFMYDTFNPFCANLSDPPTSKRLPRKSGPRRPAKTSTVPVERRSESISSAAQSVTDKLLSCAAPFLLICLVHSRLWINRSERLPSYSVLGKQRWSVELWRICLCREFFDKKVFW